MQSLKDRIDRLNTYLLKHFAGAKLHGLCMQVGRGEETLIKDLEDENPVAIDDNYNLFLYHRLIDGENFSDPEGRGSGNTYTVTHPMVMVVHTSDAFNAGRLISLLQKESDIVLVSKNHNHIEIIGREFGTLDKFDFRNYLFEIRYNIISST